MGFLHKNFTQNTIDLLEKITQLPLPRQDMYLGNINFILYHKSLSSTANQHIFQIQWGSKSIFVMKKLILKDINKIENEIKNILHIIGKYYVE